MEESAEIPPKKLPVEEFVDRHKESLRRHIEFVVGTEHRLLEQIYAETIRLLRADSEGYNARHNLENKWMRDLSEEAWTMRHIHSVLDTYGLFYKENMTSPSTGRVESTPQLERLRMYIRTHQDVINTIRSESIRTVFLLYFVEGMSVGEITSIMEIKNQRTVQEYIRSAEISLRAIQRDMHK